MEQENKEPRLFAFVIITHSLFGDIPVPMILRDENQGTYLVEGTLNDKSLNELTLDLPDGAVEMVRLASQYSDYEIFKRFNNKKITQKEFFTKLDQSFITKFLKPYFDKRWSKIFELLSDSPIGLYYKGKDKMVYELNRINVLKQKAEVVFNFIRNSEGIKYFQNIRVGGETISLTGSKAVMLTHSPVWLMIKNHLLSFSNEIDWNKLKAFLDKEFILVPQRMERQYFETFVKQSIQKYKVVNEGFKITELSPPKEAILSIENSWDGQASIILSFRYGEKIIMPHAATEKQISLVNENNEYEFFVFSRDLEWETGCMNILRKNGLIMKTESFYQLPVNENSLNSLYDTVQWINVNAPILSDSGIRIIQDRIDVNYYTGNIDLRFKTSDAVDWFDVYAEVEFDNGFKIPFVDLRSNILNDQREYEMPDGKIAVLPEEWFIKYKELMMFGREHSKQLRLKKYHLAFIQEHNQYDLSDTLHFFRELIGLTRIELPEIPQGLKATLREYQKEGFYWLDLLRRSGFGGILADDMGLGKTIQAIAILLKSAENRPGRKLNEPANQVQLSLFDEEFAPSVNFNVPSLIVVPTSLVYNWTMEIKKFAPKLKVFLHSGGFRAKDLNTFQQYHVIITTYGLIRNDVELFKDFYFDFIILDESQVIKNPGSKTHQAVMELKSRNRLVLSGTPIENTLSDLWSQMQFVNPGILGGRSFFRKFFLTAIEKGNNEERKQKLKVLINPFILRRTKEEVARELPPVTEEVVYCEMTEDQSLYYLAEKSKIRNLVLQNIEKNGLNNSAIYVLKALTQLRQIANHPFLIDTEYKGESGKFNEIIRNIETIYSENHRVLVFSSFVKHLKLFARYFDQNNIEYSMLTGQSKNRGELVEHFQGVDKAHVFLISLKAGGVGLNLTNAGYVIILDPWWNPAIEDQAISRAHRIGQDKSVFIYRFISKNTIEEKIVKLQNKKSNLAKMFINPLNPMKSMSMDNIRSLLD